jgi:hypothetical protein
LNKKLVAVFAAVGLLVATAGMASGVPKTRKHKPGKSPAASALNQSLHPDDQHGQADGHLPPARRNVDLVGRLRLTDTPGGIADVHYYKGYAYLAAWAPECPEGGVHVVDVSNPRNPRKVGFIPAGPEDYVGEGVHTIHISNNAFEGDVLLVNHEACGSNAQQGISLWDITNPRQPWPLALHTGDFTFFGEPFDFANSVHSVMGFTQDNNSKAFAVLVDNDEAGAFDVDIMNITNPGRPRMIAEVGLPDWAGAEVDAHGEDAFHHDMWFKRINGDDILGVSYWDAGWVFLNVNDPSNPEFIYDTNYPDSDLLGFSPPEGNGHQGEWSEDNRFFLGTDEDNAAFRAPHEILGGDNAGIYQGSQFAWTVPMNERYADGKAEGTTVYAGSGCPDDPDTPEVEGDVNENGIADRDEVPEASEYDAEYEEGEERIIVFTRGVCFFSEKVESGQLKGWDHVVIGNHHVGSGDGRFPNAFLCGSQGHDFDVTASGTCVGHRTMHLIFNDEPNYDTPEEPFIGADMPAIGTVGEEVSITSTFDGSGYLNLYDFETGEFLDYYAVRQAIDPDHASGSGTMTIHEIETDRRNNENLGYIAWYDVGLKVVKWTRNGIESLGTYRHAAGNDFWGVSLQQRGDRRPLIYMSDRDSGLWIFKYTGQQ